MHAFYQILNQLMVELAHGVNGPRVPINVVEELNLGTGIVINLHQNMVEKAVRMI